MTRRRALIVIVLLCAALTAGVALRWASAPPWRTLFVVDGISSVAVDAPSNRMYVGIFGEASQRVEVRDLATGRLRRVISIDSVPTLAALPGAGRILLLQPATDGTTTSISVLDARTGDALHSAFLPLSASYNPPPVRGGRIVLTSAGNESCGNTGNGQNGCSISGSAAMVLDGTTGRPLRMLHLQQRAEVAGIDVSTGHVVVVDGDGRVHLYADLFDLATSRRVHHVALAPTGVPGRWAANMAIDERTDRAFVLSVTGIFAAHPTAGAIDVIDTRRGTLVRTITLGSAPTAVGVDEATGRAFVAVDGPTRYVMKTVKGPTGAGGGIGTGGGMGTALPIGGGSLYVLDARSGKTLRTVPLGVAPSAIAVDARRGRVYVTNAGSHGAYGTAGTTSIVIPPLIHGPGGIAVLDATSGRLLRTLTLGTAPSSISLDGQSGQAIIVDAGDHMPRRVPAPWGWMPQWLRKRVPFLPRYAAHTSVTPSSVIVLDTTRL